MKIFKDFEKQIQLACNINGTVLITGETGTGKSTLARLIHSRGIRQSGPFVGINLATLHEGTFESELFGHEKGAFTGADQKRMGQLERAQGGTVFLDEVSELPLRFQARLLEFLNSRTIRPLGGKQDTHLDIRVIAATHRDLTSAIHRKEFREDLFYRLRVIPLELKPLRDQSEDFDDIVHTCLRETASIQTRSIHRISPDVARLFETYRWPGNFRELRNVLEYAVGACDGLELQKKHLPEWFLRSFTQGSELPLGGSSALGQLELPLSLDYRQTLASFEKAYFQRILNRNAGRVARSAKQIGLHKSTLRRRIRAHGLDPDVSCSPSFLGGYPSEKKS